MTKKCNKCNEQKDISEFKTHTSTADRRSNFCRACTNEKQKKYRTEISDVCTKKYEKTKKGFLVRLYRNMQSRITGVQKQKFHLYKGLPLLGRDEFYAWALSSDDFNRLFSDYEKSGYDRKLAPSVDRMDSKLGYEIHNMQFITHLQNSAKATKERWEKRETSVLTKEK